MAAITPHLAMAPSVGMGHLIPQVEIAKRLVQLHGFSITFLVPGDGPPTTSQKLFLDSLPQNMDYILLPSVSLADLPPETRVESRICLINSRSIPHLKQSLIELKARKPVVAFITDLFGTEGFHIAEELNLPAYLFFPSTAMVLSLFLYLPQLDSEVSCEFRDMDEPVRIPGCVPIHGSLLLDPFQDRKDDVYKHFLDQVKRFRMAKGILVNSFDELESGALKALQEPEPGNYKPPVYPVGPLIQIGSSGSSAEEDKTGCLDFLNAQPDSSVLFVSFGSGGTLSYDQFIELALGLELSGQRFIWVIRSPSDTSDAAYLNGGKSDNPLAFLPDGYLDRVKERGFLVPSWAPQAEILEHGSTGGFLTHCGWNSILESVANGVALIAWPLYAEQKMNAVTVTNVLKVALRPKANEVGVVEKEEIGRVVKSLIEGEEGKECRDRMMELKAATMKTLRSDGSSAKALDKVADEWKSLFTQLN
ncbi:hydroquinone glucosyltransferase-like [Impatiens glandulifera]|uniref:hydroquinone glucosyltransferase-like n=1 Tax=Impatiens glandulifera TaxID=253017 RepID=UPI001FB12F6A|nr:hydroquinone glucosyltransferase-like [Impatiens glandulifera]